MIQCCGLNVRVPTQHPGVRLLGAVHRSGISQHPVRGVGVVEDLGVERVVTDTHVDHGNSHHHRNNGLGSESKPGE